MLQQEQPQDFVIATGRQESVRRFIELVAIELGWGAIQWEGEGLHEIGRRSCGEAVMRIDPRYFRPAEVDTLLGDPSKAHETLCWNWWRSWQQAVEWVAVGHRVAAGPQAVLQLNRQEHKALGCQQFGQVDEQLGRNGQCSEALALLKAGAAQGLRAPYPARAPAAPAAAAG